MKLHAWKKINANKYQLHEYAVNIAAIWSYIIYKAHHGARATLCCVIDFYSVVSTVHNWCKTSLWSNQGRAGMLMSMHWKRWKGDIERYLLTYQPHWIPFILIQYLGIRMMRDREMRVHGVFLLSTYHPDCLWDPPPPTSLHGIFR